MQKFSREHSDINMYIGQSAGWLKILLHQYPGTLYARTVTKRMTFLQSFHLIVRVELMSMYFSDINSICNNTDP